MKRLSVIVLVSLVLLSIFAVPVIVDAHSRRAVITRSIGGFRVGTTWDQARSQFPDTIPYPGGGGWSGTLWFNHMTLEYMPRDTITANAVFVGQVSCNPNGICAMSGESPLTE